MPAGNQVQIKRSQAQALEKWIREGAHFDGVDGKATLRSLVADSGRAGERKTGRHVDQGIL